LGNKKTGRIFASMKLIGEGFVVVCTLLAKTSAELLRVEAVETQFNSIKTKSICPKKV
jgi:hypothetical protein